MVLSPALPLRRSDPVVKRVLAMTFPSYRGRKVTARVWDDRPLSLDLNWSGGTRDVAILVGPSGATWRAVADWFAAPDLVIPAGHLLVVHSTFLGADAGITIYARPSSSGSLPGFLAAGMIAAGGA